MNKWLFSHIIDVDEHSIHVIHVQTNIFDHPILSIKCSKRYSIISYLQMHCYPSQPTLEMH